MKEFSKIDFSTSAHYKTISHKKDHEDSSPKTPERVCSVSSQLTLDIIQERIYDCCTDKVVTRFIQDRLRLSDNYEEKIEFYERVY